MLEKEWETDMLKSFSRLWIVATNTSNMRAMSTALNP